MPTILSDLPPGIFTMIYQHLFLEHKRELSHQGVSRWTPSFHGDKSYADPENLTVNKAIRADAFAHPRQAGNSIPARRLGQRLPLQFSLVPS